MHLGNRECTAKTRKVECSTLFLKGPGKKDLQIGFKLYKERDLNMVSSPVMQNLEVKDPAIDFDCPTESEQAESSARAMDLQILEALQKFDTDKNTVANANKFKRKSQGR